MAVGRAEDVVDVEDVVGVLVVHALVARRDRRLGEDAPRIVRVLVAERRIDGLICRREMRRERAQGLIGQRLQCRIHTHRQRRAGGVCSPTVRPLAHDGPQVVRAVTQPPKARLRRGGARTGRWARRVGVVLRGRVLESARAGRGVHRGRQRAAWAARHRRCTRQGRQPWPRPRRPLSVRVRLAGVARRPKAGLTVAVGHGERDMVVLRRRAVVVHGATADRGRESTDAGTDAVRSARRVAETADS